MFAYRKEQAWPSTIIKGEGWDALYAAQAEGLDALATADEAVAWANALVVKIAISTQESTTAVQYVQFSEAGWYIKLGEKELLDRTIVGTPHDYIKWHNEERTKLSLKGLCSINTEKR